MAIDYKIKSAITIASILVIMVTLGILVNKFQGGITGAAITQGVACENNDQCSDGIACTVDSCKNPGTELSFCSNSVVDYCQNDDNCCPPGCYTSDNDC